eukprot:6776597-Pyramimonas_sp.AAC.2
MGSAGGGDVVPAPARHVSALARRRRHEPHAVPPPAGPGVGIRRPAAQRPPQEPRCVPSGSPSSRVEVASLSFRMPASKCAPRALLNVLLG